MGGMKDAASVFGRRESLDPALQKGQQSKVPKFTSGTVSPIFDRLELGQLLDSHADKLVVLMCKSSHCKPCHKFNRKYQYLAARFQDAVLCTILGDLHRDNRALMIEWKVKATPTFRLYRNKELLTQFSGRGRLLLLLLVV